MERINLTQYTNILSFDCGYDPFAACIISISKKYPTQLKCIKDKMKQEIKLLQNKEDSIETMKELLLSLEYWMKRIRQIIDHCIIIHRLHTVNLLYNEKLKHIDDVVKISRIKQCLLDIDTYIENHKIPIDAVLCEEQQLPNKDIQSIRSIIIYHYTSPMKKEIIIQHPKLYIVNPRIKNRICLSSDTTLSHKIYIEKYSIYVANKQHCRDNLLHFINVFDLHHLFKFIKKYPKRKQTKYYRDMGDAFCQAICWFHNAS